MLNSRLGKFILTFFLGLTAYHAAVVEAAGVHNMNAMWRRQNISTSWIGKIGTATSGGAAGCSTAIAGNLTPGWCTGGTGQSNTGDGSFTPGAADIAVDNLSGYFYVSDSTAHKISRFNLTTGAYAGSIGKTTSSSGTCPVGAVSGWCTGGTFGIGPGDGMFAAPRGLFVDAANDILYVADSNNYRITRIRASSGAYLGSIGNITASVGTCPATGATSSWCVGGTFGPGTGDGMFSMPRGISVDTNTGNLFIAETGQHRISKFSNSGTFMGWIGKINSVSGLGGASGCSSTLSGNFTPGWCMGGTSQFGQGDGMMTSPKGIFIDPSGDRLYVADAGNFRISKYVTSTGAYVGSIGNISTAGGTCFPSGAATTWCTGGIFATGTGDGMMNAPNSITAGINGKLYVADVGSHKILKINAATGAFIGWMGKILSTSPTGGAAACKGAAASTATPGWCTGGTGTAGTGDGMFNAPNAVSYSSTTNSLYILDSSNARVVRFTGFDP